VIASRVAEFVERYSPEIARDFRACRRKIRSLVPRGYELVYDNYSALGIGYGPGEKASDVIVSIVAYPRWITLFFLKGAGLMDPDSLLQGKGSQVRSIRLRSPNDLEHQGAQHLIAQALAPYSEALSSCPKVTTIIKATATKRRPRRPSGRTSGKVAKSKRKTVQ
jgi:hypothetical protein